MLDLNFFQDKNSPQKFVLVNVSCQKPNSVPYIIKEWLLKILTHPKMGICKGAPGLLSIITGNFAQFVNTTGGWCFERQINIFRFEQSYVPPSPFLPLLHLSGIPISFDTLWILPPPWGSQFLESASDILQSGDNLSGAKLPQSKLFRISHPRLPPW